MGITPKNWESYFYTGSEGMGTLYERIVLERFLKSIVRKFKIKTVLECPCFGMTGYTGINSIKLAKMGIDVYVADDDPKRLHFIKKIWTLSKTAGNFIKIDDYTNLPFKSKEFDMVWNFASLWYLRHYELSSVIEELARVSKSILLIFIPNKNIFYIFRKVFEKNLWMFVDEHVLSKEFQNSMEKILKDIGFELVETGFIDCPPWPDIAIRIGDVLYHDKITLPEYLVDYSKLIEMLTFMERLPNFVKSLWAHHRYFLFCRKAYQLRFNVG